MLRSSAFALAAVAVVTLASGCGTSSSSDSSVASNDVVTKSCPDRINASFGDLDAYSFEEIGKRRGYALNDDEKDELRDPLRRLATQMFDFDALLALEKAENAVCTYRAATPDSKVSAKFYTNQGKNILRIDANDGVAKDMSVYLTIKDYSKTSITASFASAGIYFRGHDADISFIPYDIGKASSVAIGVGDAVPAQPLTDDALEAALKSAVADVLYVSESDTAYDVYRAPIAAGEKVDAATVKQKFNGLPNTDEEGTALRDLVGHDESGFSKWFEGSVIPDSESDEDYQKHAAAMRAVHVLMSSTLTDLKVVYVASSSLEDTHDVGWVQIFIVGRSASGTLFAVHTGAAWT